MIYKFLRNLRNPLAIRLLAAFGILLVPVLAMVAISIGIGALIVTLAKEGYDLITDEIPAFVADLFGAVKSGKVTF